MHLGKPERTLSISIALQNAKRQVFPRKNQGGRRGSEAKLGIKNMEFFLFFLILNKKWNDMMVINVIPKERRSIVVVGRWWEGRRSRSGVTPPSCSFLSSFMNLRLRQSAYCSCPFSFLSFLLFIIFFFFFFQVKNNCIEK